MTESFKKASLRKYDGWIRELEERLHLIANGGLGTSDDAGLAKETKSSLAALRSLRDYYEKTMPDEG